MENWKVGKTGGCVVTDSSEGFENQTGHLDSEYYGGILIAESIWRKKDIALISAAPDLLACLKEAIEGLSENESKVNEKWETAIKKATQY